MMIMNARIEIPKSTELVDLETLELSEAQSFGGLGIGLNVASI